MPSSSPREPSPHLNAPPLSRPLQPGGHVDPGSNPDPHHTLKAWIAAILWLTVIAIESTNIGSANNTGRILYPVLHFLFGIDQVQFEPWHHVIRKLGHIFGYGLLSILLFRAWRETLPLPSNHKWTFRWANLAVLGTALVASLDEWHQSFLPSRTGRWQDVVLDTCAGIAAQLLLALYGRWF
jgi:VanZ family protein